VLCRALQDERRGLPRIEVFDEGDADAGELWAALGGEGPVAPASEGGDDANAGAAAPTKTLFRLSDGEGDIKFVEEARGRVTASMFDAADVFIFDCGFEIFVWRARPRASPLCAFRLPRLAAPLARWESRSLRLLPPYPIPLPPALSLSLPRPSMCRIGRGTTANERRQAMSYAERYVRENQKASARVTRVMDGGEAEAFNAALDV